MRKRRKAPRGTKTGTATGGGGLFSSVERLTTHKNQHTKQRLGWPRGKEKTRALKSLRGDEFEQWVSWVPKMRDPDQYQSIASNSKQEYSAVSELVGLDIEPIKLWNFSYIE